MCNEIFINIGMFKGIISSRALSKHLGLLSNDEEIVQASIRPTT